MLHFARRQVMRSLAPAPGEHILDIGVGTGLNLPHYPAGVLVTGIDISPAMLAKARQKHSKAKVKLIIMDASRTTFKRSTFDKALATYVLRVAPKPKEILREIARITKPRARFVILDQFKESQSILFSLIVPFQLALGWGKNYRLADLLKGTPWKIVSKKRFGRMRGTQLVILENCKNA